jgi:hypothetical protein
MLVAALSIAPPAHATPSFTASFSGGKLGGSAALHFRFLDPPAADGSLPEAVMPIIITPPTGTKLLKKVPRGALCDIKTAQRTAGADCPKESRVGPSGSVRWAAVVGSQRVERTVKITPVFSRAGVSLVGPAASPFLATEMILKWFPASLNSPTTGLIFDTGVGVVGPLPPDESTTYDTILEVSLTLSGTLRDRHGQHPVVVMPASCPPGGFRWAVTAGGTVVEHLEATSPCP